MNFRNPVIPVTGIDTGTNTFLLTQVVTVLCGWADLNYNWVFPSFLVWLIAMKMMPWKDSDLRTLFVLSSLLVTFYGLSIYLVPFGLLCYGCDQEKMPTLVTVWVKEFAALVNCLEIPVGYPYIGSNSESYWEKLKEWACEVDIPVFYSVQSAKIRPLGVNEAVSDISDRTMLDDPRELQKLLRLAGQHRNAVSCALLAIVAYALGITGILAYVFMAVLYLSTADDGSRIEYGSRGLVVSDGIYLINTNLMGLTIEHGIGTCVNGILHVPYHVSHGMNINLGKSLLKPTYVSSRDDIVTYGGMPQFVKPDQGEDLFINTERQDGRTTYKTVAKIDDAEGYLTWSAVTMPGESGSPVFVKREGNLQLSALAGRWVKSNPTNATEYAKTYHNIEIPDTAGNIQQVIRAPGTGKTRVVLPQLVAKEIVRKKLTRILVTGPTRVVCEELYEALKGQGMDVGLNIKGSKNTGKVNCRARIQIAAHNSMLSMLLRSDGLVRNASMLLIDEAHFRDRATIMLRQYARSMAEDGVRIVEMSATIDGQFADTSNYDIVDVEIQERDVASNLEADLEHGYRALVFVPGVKGVAFDKLTRKFADYKPVILSREKYEAGMQGVRDTERRLIFSTDIAECGINIPDLDVVYDYQQKFDFYLEGGVIGGETRSINLASHIQRRGRVGRTKPGSYKYVKREYNECSIDSAAIDAEVCMTGRKWSAKLSNELGITLTDPQVLVVLEQGRSPTEVHLRFDALGNKKADISKELESWKRGPVHYSGCGRCGKRCETTCKFYDERLHDWLVSDKPIVLHHEL